MKNFLLIFILLLSYTKADQLTINKASWSLIKNKFDNQNVHTISPTADLIMTYKNDKWYALSPTGFYSKNLEERNIESFEILNAGEAFWILFSDNNSKIYLNGDNPLHNTIVLKKGWNLVSIPSFDTYIVPSYYFNENDINSIWTYDNYNKSWNAYSSNSDIKNDIKNDDTINLIETINASDAFWINSNLDINITINNIAPFFVKDVSSYHINEKDLNEFSIKALDPNGDNITFTISGEDQDFFEIDLSNNAIKFKPLNTKPVKSIFNLNINLNDGQNVIDKDFTINVSLRYENNYNGIYAKVSSHDNNDDFSKQWYLDEDHLNINTIHNEYNGSSEFSPTIQIVEAGFQTSHEDLIANMDFSMAYDYQNKIDGNASNIDNAHATAVAGIIGARGYNAIGIRGIVPFGKITGFKFATNSDHSLDISDDAIRLAWAYGPRANDIDVSNNSWLACKSFSLSYEKYMEYASQNLRDQKGRIFVIAAGNSRQESAACSSGSTNLNTNLNSPYSIVVAAMNKQDKISSTSSKGSNIMLSAYGTDIIWSTFGKNNLKYAAFSGTSAAAPMVSGAIGLILEACPSLMYRDVHYILSKTATKVDESSNSWITNDANNAYSTDYGFGKINTQTAIQMCKNSYTPLEDEIKISKRKTINQHINSTNFTMDIDISESKKVNYVSISLNAYIQNAGEYEINLISPNGSKIQLLHGNNNIKNYTINYDQSGLDDNDNDVFRLSTIGFLEENSYGNWKIQFVDKNTANSKSNNFIKEIKLDILAY